MGVSNKDGKCVATMAALPSLGGAAEVYDNKGNPSCHLKRQGKRDGASCNL